MSQSMKSAKTVIRNESASLQTGGPKFHPWIQESACSDAEALQGLENAMRDRLAYLEDRIAQMKKEIRDEPPKHIDEENCVVADDMVFRTVLQGRMAEIRQIQSALFRMKNETYGFCLNCDEPISLGRLQLLPFTAYCAKCTE